jgi:hypothetical protein
MIVALRTDLPGQWRVCQKECLVIQRKTQTEVYWKEEFEITDQDTTGVYDLVLEEGEPVPTEALVVWLMERHCRLEEAAIQTELSKGPAFQPAEQYEVGQQLIFPAFEYTLGTVVGAREANSPEYGDFTAIQVQFEGNISSIGPEAKLDFSLRRIFFRVSSSTNCTVLELRRSSALRCRSTRNLSSSEPTGS